MFAGVTVVRCDVFFLFRATTTNFISSKTVFLLFGGEALQFAFIFKRKKIENFYSLC